MDFREVHIIGLLLGLSLAFSGSAWAGVSRLLEKTFPCEIKETPVMWLSTELGDVRVETADVDTVTVRARMDFVTPQADKADALQRELRLVMEKRPEGVWVSAVSPRRFYWTFEAWPPLKLSFAILVPRQCELNVVTREGSVQIGEMKGACKISTETGWVFIQGIDGSLDVRSASGEMVVSHGRGDLKLRSRTGGFRVGPVQGNIEAYGGGGELTVGESAGRVVAETCGADLNVVLPQNLPVSTSLVADGADVTLQMPPQSSCTLDLRASLFGRVYYDSGRLPLVPRYGASGASRVQATLHGGGALVAARASGGHVFLQAIAAVP